jgi:hypothetical protein
VRPLWRNALAAPVNRFTSSTQIRHLVIAITVPRNAAQGTRSKHYSDFDFRGLSDKRASRRNIRRIGSRLLPLKSGRCCKISSRVAVSVNLVRSEALAIALPHPHTTHTPGAEAPERWQEIRYPPPFRRTHSRAHTRDDHYTPMMVAPAIDFVPVTGGRGSCMLDARPKRNDQARPRLTGRPRRARKGMILPIVRSCWQRG